MTEASEVPGADVVLWLPRVPPEEAANLLAGCSLDDDSSDQLAPIVAFDRERNAIVVADGRRIPIARLRAGVIVDPRPGAPLRQAVLASRTPAEQQEREERAALGKAGVDPGKLASPEDRHAVLALLRSADTGPLPTYQARQAGYLALSASADPGLARFGARLFAALATRNAAAGPTPDDLHWRWTWFLRTSGHLQDAIAVSGVLDTGDLTDPGDRKVLARIRAATLLDLFDRDGNGKWVPLAEKSASLARTLGPRDDEAGSLDRRLQAARRRLGRES